MARTAKRYMAVKDTVETSETYKTALYARLSVDRNSKNTESIENQMEIIKKYVMKHPEFKNYKAYIDKGYSGTTFERPAFTELMADVKAGRINAIIVKDLSRFGRNDLETSNLLETILPFLQVRFISVNDKYDSADNISSNKALEIALKNIVNDMYAKDISKKVYTSRRNDMERGKFTGKDAPYGYILDKETKSFVVDEKAAPVIRLIYQMASEGKSYRDIIVFLSESKYSKPGLYKKTGKLKTDDEKEFAWHIGTISSILNNKTYTGTMIQGKRVSRLFDGEKKHAVDESEWIEIPNAHEAIVTLEEFQKVRCIIDEKAENMTFNRDSGRKLKINDNKYKKILKCGVCGATLQRASEIRTVKGHKYRNYYYFCSRGDNRSKSRACGVRITENKLDEIFYDTLLKTATRLLDNDSEEGMASKYDLECFRTKSEEILNDMTLKYNNHRKILIQKADGYKFDMAEIYAQYSEGNITKNEYILLEREHKELSDDLKDEITELDNSYSNQSREIKSLINWFESLLQGKKRKRYFFDETLINSLVTEIRVMPQHELEIDLPIGGGAMS